MKTILEKTAQIFRADWGPTMKASTRVLALAVAIPAAIVWVVAQWLLFTYRKPLAGVLALVPVRKRDPIDAIMDAITASSEAAAGISAGELGRASSYTPASIKPSAAPISLVLAPGPRRQRRGSKQSQSPA